MTEGVFRILQLGAQAGTLAAPGAAVAATILYPCEPGGPPTLDRASTIPNEDVGRNARNRPGRGYHGIRAAELPFESDVRFEDAMRLLEMHYAGGVVPTGAGPYTWVYALEAGIPTVKPYTIEEGIPGDTNDQWRITSAVINELTLEFDALAAPGVSPWRASGTIIGFDREVSPLTAALSAPATLETAQGHLTILKDGSTATAYAALTELSASLIRHSMTSTRNFVLRPYGGTTDLATLIGFSEKTTVTFETMLRITNATKAAAYDTFNSAGGAITDRRWRLACTGSGTKSMLIDGRVSIFQVNHDDRDGERVYGVSGEYVDDSTLNAPVAITLVNGVATLA